jgi:hypothetical protein
MPDFVLDSYALSVHCAAIFKPTWQVGNRACDTVPSWNKEDDINFLLFLMDLVQLQYLFF